MAARPEVLIVLRACKAGDALELELDDGLRLQSTFAAIAGDKLVVSIGSLERELGLETIERATVLSAQEPSAPE